MFLELSCSPCPSSEACAPLVRISKRRPVPPTTRHPLLEQRPDDSEGSEQTLECPAGDGKATQRERDLLQLFVALSEGLGVHLGQRGPRGVCSQHADCLHLVNSQKGYGTPACNGKILHLIWFLLFGRQLS